MLDTQRGYKSQVRWLRYVDGYRIEAIEGVERLLVQGEAPATEYYDPLRMPVLVDFLEVKDRPSIVAFANRYGFLHEGYSSIHSGLDWDFGPGESIRDWFYESVSIHRCVHVWELLNLGQTSRLKEIVRWSQINVEAVFPDRSYFLIASSANSRTAHWWRTLKRGDVLQPARIFLAGQLQENLVRDVEPSISLVDSGKMRLEFLPKTLRGCIWLQLAEIMEGTRQLRRCTAPDCGRWMDVTHSRSHKTMHDRCSNRIRMARYRSRQRGDFAE